jgi:serine/threonine protein kinase
MIGKKLAHYTILEPLGAGGMGDVYLALDTRLNRKVALKTLQSDGERPTDQLTRLRREARAGAALNHPGVVTVYAVEESEGTVFITMEHVIGCTLRSLIEPGGMAVSTFRNITRQMASAVAAAHAAGVVHRDLKPSNVMLDKENQVKILDFGLARITEPEAAPADRTMSLSELTLPGSIMGTMPYMSPEQICGLTADARSDVFALGTVFYEMATGERPFAGQSVAELTSAIMRRTPRPIREARPGFPAGLVEVIDNCLHKEPEDRYRQAGELAEALARAPERSPVAAPASNSALTKPLLGVLDFSNITGDPDSAWLATGIAESVTVDLNKFPEVRTRTREEMVAAWLNEDQQSQAAVMAVARNLGLDFLITGGYQKMGNRVRITGQVLDVSAGTVAGVVKLDGSMEEVFDLQDRILSGLLKSANLANISLKREALVPRGPGTLQAYELYSRAKGLLLDMGVKAFDDAEELLMEALRLDPEYALAHTAFGHLRSMRFIATTDRRDLDEAIEHLEEARRVDPDLDEPLVWLTYCLGRLDRFEEAISVGEQAIALNPSRPQAHYFTGVAHWMRGASNYETGDWEAAARHLKRACKIQPTYQPAFMTRFDVLFRQGRWDEARRILWR